MLPIAWIPLIAAVVCAAQPLSPGQAPTDIAKTRRGICQNLRQSAGAIAEARGMPLAIVRGQLAAEFEGTAPGHIPEETIGWFRNSAITLVVTAETDCYFPGHPGASLKIYVPSGGTLHYSDAQAHTLDGALLERLAASAKVNNFDNPRPPRLDQIGRSADQLGQHDLAGDVYVFMWDAHDGGRQGPRLDMAMADTMWGPILETSALGTRMRPRWDRLEKGMRDGSQDDAIDWIVLGTALERSDDKGDQEILDSLLKRAGAAGADQDALRRARTVVEMINSSRRIREAVERAKREDREP